MMMSLVHGFVQFALFVLDKFQRANSDEFNLVGGEAKKNKASSDINQSPDIRKAIANTMGNVGTGVATLGYVMLNREIERWETARFNLCKTLEDLEDEYEDADDGRLRKKFVRYEKRVADLSTCIKEAKRKYNHINKL